MIKINISSEKMKEIKKKHLKWFQKHLNSSKGNKIEESYKNLKNEKEKQFLLYLCTGNIKNINEITDEINSKDIDLDFLTETLISGTILELKSIKKVIEENFKSFKNFNKVFYLKDFIIQKREEVKKDKDNEAKIFKEIEKEIDDIKSFCDETKFKALLKDFDEKRNKNLGAKQIFLDIRKLNGVSTIDAEIKKIFDYKKFSQTNETEIEKDENKNSIFWGRHSLITNLGVQVCPYCNRQYITNYKEEDIKNKEKYIKNKTTADLDHFYIKSEYPYFALSLYNFIPSCQICNSRFKLDCDFFENEVIYPYEEEFGDEAKFSIKLTNDSENEIDQIKEKLIKEYDSDVFYGNSDNFIIHFNIQEHSKNSEKIKNSITTFKLRKVYQYHKDYVRELIKKSIIYNESRIDELYREYEGTLFNSREDVIQMIVSNYIDDEKLDKRVLSKLTKDICEELGIGYL